jgi:putative hemolysin
MAVDESGGVVGLVTLEDLLEELVGEILGENDPAPAALAFGPDGSAVLPGMTPIREINRVLGLELPEPGEVQTIAGLCLQAAQAIPEPGVTLAMADGSRVEVLEVSARRVRKVRLWPPPAAPASGGA